MSFRLRIVVWALLFAGLLSLSVNQPRAWWQSIQQVAISGGGGRTCTDGTNAAAFNARTSGQNNAHLDANCVFINGLDTDGLFTIGDAAYLIATDTSGNAALNIISSSYTLTVNGSPTFTANSGYVGGSASNLDTGFNASTAGGHFVQNTNSAFIWTLTTLSGGVDYGAAASDDLAVGVSAMYIYPHFSDNTFYWLQQTRTGSVTATGHFYGFVSVNSGATDLLGYVDTTSTAAAAGAATGLSNASFILLNRQANVNPFTANIAFAWFGGTLNSTQQGNLCHRVYVYMSTIAGASGATC